MRDDMAAQPKATAYREFQGQGSPHADKDGWAWCGATLDAHNRPTNAQYLEAKTEADAIKEVAVRFNVKNEEIIVK